MTSRAPRRFAHEPRTADRLLADFEAALGHPLLVTLGTLADALLELALAADVLLASQVEREAVRQGAIEAVTALRIAPAPHLLVAAAWRDASRIARAAA